MSTNLSTRNNRSHLTAAALARNGRLQPALADAAPDDAASMESRLAAHRASCVQIGEAVAFGYEERLKGLRQHDSEKVSLLWGTRAWPGVRLHKESETHEFYWATRKSSDDRQAARLAALYPTFKARPQSRYIPLHGVPEEPDPTKLFYRRPYTDAHFDLAPVHPLERKFAAHVEAQICGPLRLGYFASIKLLSLEKRFFIPGNTQAILAGVLADVLASHGGLSPSAATDAATRHPWPGPAVSDPPSSPPLNIDPEHEATALQVELWADIAPRLGQFVQQAFGVFADYLAVYEAYARYSATPVGRGPLIAPICLLDGSGRPVIEWVPAKRPIAPYDFVALSRTRDRVGINRMGRRSRGQQRAEPLTPTTAWWANHDPSTRALSAWCMPEEAHVASAFCRQRIAPLRDALLAGEEMRQRIVALRDPYALPSLDQCFEDLFPEAAERRP